MKILDVDQGSKIWLDARMCKVTSTKLISVMGTKEAYRSIIAELISEEATEQVKNIKTTAEMERGNSEEDFAIQKFEKQTGKKVDKIGLCIHDDFDWIALSPDGLIKNSEGKYTEAIEIKCPMSQKAILYRILNKIPMEETGLLGAKGQALAGAPFLGIPNDYKWQVVHYFLVNKDLEKLYFGVYDVRIINDEEKLYIVEVERSNEILQEAIKEAEEKLKEFRETWLKWKEIILPTNF